VHGKNYFWEKLRRRVAYRLVSRHGRMVAVSQDLKRFIHEKVGIPETRVEVIYNGVALAQTVTDEDVQKCKVELGISGGYPVLGVVGSLYPVKGHRFLLEAMPEILGRWPKAQLLVIGRGELEIALKEQVEQLVIGANVHFLGMRQDVSRLLSLLDAFVLPSSSEGLSIALLEAMASGKPVVATRVGGNPELIDHGRTGFLAQPEDARDLAANLLKLLSDPGTMHQFGRQAAERVRQHFSMEQMADRYRDLYVRSLNVHNSVVNKK
jgi:glycosyltransferase involved in cell wall biosynthesis